MLHVLHRWWQALLAWHIRLRLRCLQAERNRLCRLATGHTYAELSGPEHDGPQAPEQAGEEG
jgi:hypothetical protein